MTTPAQIEIESKSHVLPTQPPIKLHPTIPPSTNNLYANLPRGGRVPTKAYKAWRTLNAVLCKQQLAGRKISGPVAVEILIRGGKGWREDRDLDNCCKACLDMVVALEVIPSDTCQVVRDVRVRYLAAAVGKKKQPAAITVVVKEFEEILWVSP